MESIINTKTIFPKNEYHNPGWFIIDASGKTLGRMASEASKILCGKEKSFFTPGVNQGNYVIVLNADKIRVSGKKEKQKLYRRNSQRPGGLKIETLAQLRKRVPSRIVEKAIWGMLPKGVLGREYYRRLFVYSTGILPYKKNLAQNNSNLILDKAWVNVSL